jgi:hypothetical protein
MSTYQQQSDPISESETVILETPISNSEPSSTRSSGKIPFWVNDPNVLLQQGSELFPTQNMSLEKRLNAISRTVIILTFLVFIYTQRARTLIMGGITLAAIVFFYSVETKGSLEPFVNKGSLDSFVNKGSSTEPFISKVVKDTLDDKGITVPTDVFDQSTSINPYSNVMLTDYEYNVNKKPAPPASNPIVADNILKNAKQQCIELNGTNSDIADKLFNGLEGNYVFEQSQRQFVSQPNTMIPNDQGAFANFLYGNMPSCKEGNLFACARQKSNYNLY